MKHIGFLVAASAMFVLIAGGVEAKGFHSSGSSSSSSSMRQPSPFGGSSGGFGHSAPAPAPSGGSFGSNRPANTGAFSAIPHAATLPPRPAPKALVLNTPPHAPVPAPHAVVLAHNSAAAPHAVTLPGRPSSGGFHSTPPPSYNYGYRGSQVIVVHHYYSRGVYDGYRMPYDYYPGAHPYYYGGWGYTPIYNGAAGLVFLMAVDSLGHEHRIDCANPFNHYEKLRCEAAGYSYWFWSPAFYM